MGNDQEAKIGYFRQEGEEVTEWTHCASISHGQRLQVLEPNEWFHSWWRWLSKPRSLMAITEHPLFGPMMHERRTWIRDGRISRTHFMSLHVFKNITWAKRVPPIFTKTTCKPFRHSWIQSLWGSCTWIGQVSPVLRTRNVGHRELMWFSRRGLHHATPPPKWYGVEAAFFSLGEGVERGRNNMWVPALCQALNSRE